MAFVERGEKKPFRLGISGKMILNVAVPTVAILLILAMIVTTTVVNTIWGLKNTDMENQMEAVANQVTQYFEPFFVNTEFVSDRASVKNIFAEMEQSPSTYRFETSTLYQQTMRDLQYAENVAGEGVLSVWIAGVKNNQVIQSDGFISDLSYDEIGDLEEIFAKTQSNLKGIIEDIATVLHEISSKNLTVRTSAVYQGDFVAIKESLQGITTAMNGTMLRVRTAAAQVDAGSTQVSDGAQALAQGTTE